MKTTAHHLLSLVFDGHEIRTTFVDDKVVFIAADAGKALGLSNIRKAISALLPEERAAVTISDTSSGKRKSGQRETQTLSATTESGLYALIFRSRMPAAIQFRLWISQDVMPQLLKYGTYAPGATTGERCAALRGRWLEERELGKARDAEAYAASGLLTIAAFRKISPVPVRNVLEFCAVLRSKATLAGYEPQRFYTGPKRHTPAWPRELLHEAARATTHFLPFSLEN